MKGARLFGAFLAVILAQVLTSGCAREEAPAKAADAAPAVIERTAQRIRVGEARHAAVGGLSGEPRSPGGVPGAGALRCR